MKKTVSILLAFVLIFFVGSVYAADEYAFNLEYVGDVIVNEEKDAAVTLTGTNGTLYTNVRIKVDIEGPATPQLIAYDSNGTKFDIAQLGYWGPDVGFAVQGDFTNRTPIKATFTKAGDYKITLSLINVASNNSVITTKEITVTVKDIEKPAENVIENVTENNVAEIPKTGASYEDMAFLAVAILAIIYIAYKIYFKKYKV